MGAGTMATVLWVDNHEERDDDDGTVTRRLPTALVVVDGDQDGGVDRWCTSLSTAAKRITGVPTNGHSRWHAFDNAAQSWRPVGDVRREAGGGGWTNSDAARDALRQWQERPAAAPIALHPPPPSPVVENSRPKRRRAPTPSTTTTTATSGDGPRILAADVLRRLTITAMRAGTVRCDAVIDECRRLGGGDDGFLRARLEVAEAVADACL